MTNHTVIIEHDSALHGTFPLQAVKNIVGITSVDIIAENIVTQSVEIKYDTKEDNNKAHVEFGMLLQKVLMWYSTANRFS